MKIIFYPALAFLFTANYIFLIESNLPFENKEITIEKVMAGFFVLFAYFIPTIIARDKIHFKRLFLFNLLTAWTVFGWFISFLWAIKAKSKNSNQEESHNNLDD